MSETITEQIFRDFYKDSGFIEKSAIDSNRFKFTTKNKINNNNNKGYPDFFKECENYIICVECKALTKDHELAKKEVQHYMLDISKNYNVIGIALSGQNAEVIGGGAIKIYQLSIFI
jgi:hypothetical protein